MTKQRANGASPNPRRKGRPPKFVNDDAGKQIHGLSAQPYKGGHRFYATFSEPREWFGIERRLAIQRFRSWESKQAEETIPVSFPKRPTGSQKKRAEEWAKKLDGQVIDFRTYDFSKIPDEIQRRLKMIFLLPDFADWKFRLRVDTFGSLPHTSEIPAAFFWARIRDLIIENPRLAAEKIGIKELAYLIDLKPPVLSLTLAEIPVLYLAKRFGDRDEPQRVKKAWQEFSRLVNAASVKGVTQDGIDRYHRIVTDGRYGKKTIKSRFDRIAAIIDHAYKRRKENRPELAELKTDFRSICTIRVGKKGKPKPIHVDDFHALYQAADSTKMQAIALCMLNFGLHPSEATSLTKEDIDLRQKHLWTNRSKTGEVERVGRAWKETITAIKRYQKEQKTNATYRQSDYLFLTRVDKPYARGGLGDYFRETWKPRAEKMSGRRLRLTLDSLRDGAQNAADEADCDPIHTAMLLGHVLPGVGDAYKTRRPKKTERSVQAIYERYDIASLP